MYHIHWKNTVVVVVGGWSVYCVRKNKAAGGFVYHLTGEIRQQDDMRVMSIGEIRLWSSLHMASFAEEVDPPGWEPSVGGRGTPAQGSH